MTPTEVRARAACVDVALRWGTGYDTDGPVVRQHHRHPQGRHPPSRGSSRRLLKTCASRSSGNARRLKVALKDDRLEKDDVLEGLTAVVTVRLAEPQFEGQTKEVLGTTAVARHRRQRRRQGADARCSPRPSATTRRSRRCCSTRSSAEMRTRVAARQHKETQRRKNALETSLAAGQARRLPHATTSTAPSCSSSRATRALGTAKLARTSEFQALLPIRGKILNVQKASVGDMLSNAECASIIQVVGAGSGRTLRPRAPPATARSS